MENNLKFNSSICTSIEQSKRLLELGLKKETADMSYIPMVANHRVVYRLDCSTPKSIDIPAWSLHRLIEIAEANDIAFLDISKMYNTCIKIIEGRIYAGLINKNYLEETICQQD